MLTNKDEIKAWLDSHDVKNYSISPEGFVSCSESVNLANHKLAEIAVQFSYVRGSFDVSSNQLKSLKGCPLEVGMAFYCTQNQLTSLEGGPQTVGTSYQCSNNSLTSLKGCPEIIPKFLHANTNYLTSLEFCPKSVRAVNVIDNPIRTLEWYPQTLEKNIRLSHDTVKIKGLESFYDEDNTLSLDAKTIATIKMQERFHESFKVGKNVQRKKI